MGFFARLFEKRGLSLTNYTQWKELGIVGPTSSGVPVTATSALNYTAVLAAVRVLAESIASLPLIVYERLPGEQGKRRVRCPLRRPVAGVPVPGLVRRARPARRANGLAGARVGRSGRHASRCGNAAGNP